TRRRSSRRRRCRCCGRRVVVSTPPRVGKHRWMNAVLDYVSAQRKAIHDNIPGVREGDPDAVHDTRVAIRRLRSTLRTFRGLWDPTRSEGLRSELKWLGTRLGNVRDGQVMSAALSGAVHSEPPELVAGPVAARLQRRLAGETLPAQDELRDTL